jgi:peptidoglycan/LPS O-acetylase OafA/YrhL
LPNADSKPGPEAKSRRWTIVAAGLLLLALALVVIYTSRGAFLSPLSLVVVAAIGLAALLLQLRMRQNRTARIRSPLGLNVLGIVFAAVAVFVDVKHSGSRWMLIAALGAVFCFAISGAIVLDGLRKDRA